MRLPAPSLEVGTRIAFWCMVVCITCTVASLVLRLLLALGVLT